jgi:hypothetical protein
MMPPLPQRAAPRSRDDTLIATLTAQVQALMLNAQRYEMRAAVHAALGEYDKVAGAWEASDHFASQAFSCINQVIEGHGDQVLVRYTSREEALKAEVPDATELNPRAINPEVPDSDGPDDEIVVDAEGRVIANPNA